MKTKTAASILEEHLGPQDTLDMTDSQWHHVKDAMRHYAIQSLEKVRDSIGSLSAGAWQIVEDEIKEL